MHVLASPPLSVVQSDLVVLPGRECPDDNSCEILERRRDYEGQSDRDEGEGVRKPGLSIAPGDGAQVFVTNLVRFNVGSVAKISAMYWRADVDGTVFRVAVSAAPYVPATYLVEQLHAVMGSLRRID
jgi:hypothetical protein